MSADSETLVHRFFEELCNVDGVGRARPASAGGSGPNARAGLSAGMARAERTARPRKTPRAGRNRRL